MEDASASHRRINPPPPNIAAGQGCANHPGRPHHPGRASPLESARDQAHRPLTQIKIGRHGSTYRTRRAPTTLTADAWRVLAEQDRAEMQAEFDKLAGLVERIVNPSADNVVPLLRG